jgi:hypothetical protein
VKDIDDVLRSVGRESGPDHFKGLLAKAKPAPEFLLKELKNVPREKKSEYATRFARAILKCPPLEQENLQKRMAKALGTTARTVKDILAQARKKPARKASSRRPTQGQPSSLIMDDLRYRWTPAGLEKVEYREVEGQTVESSKVVANFLIRIERESEVIDDLRNHKKFECRLLLAGRAEDDAGRSVRIEAAHFGSNHRLAEALAAAGHWEARCSSKHMDFVRMASSAYSGERGVARVKTVRYVGLHVVELPAAFPALRDELPFADAHGAVALVLPVDRIARDLVVVEGGDEAPPLHRPIHVVATENEEDETVIVTVYEPGPDRWTDGFTRRRKP